ncbi:MAG TPA: hypothetical protein VGL77_03660 [Armatimonadota bacterium]|jgi:hypothetical protein
MMNLPAVACDQKDGCGTVRVLKTRVDDHDDVLKGHKEDISGIHRRIDMILLAVLGTLGTAVITLIVTVVKG